MYNFYVYPPTDVASLLFFALNPEAEREAHRLVESLELGEESKLMLLDYLSIAERLPGDLSDVYIDVEEPDREIEAYGTIAPSGRVLEKVEAAFVGDDKEPDYSVTLRIDGDEVTYTLAHSNRRKALEILLREFVPPDDLKAAETLARRAERAALRTYLIAAAMKKLREEEGDEEESS